MSNVFEIRTAYEKVSAQNCLLISENQRLKEENKGLIKSNNRLYENQKKMKEDHKQEVDTLRAENAKLKNLLAHAIALSNRDSTNSGIPTSQTPINKSKYNSNLREKTGKKRGGQPGRTKTTMNNFESSEATDTVDHTIDTEETQCSRCDGALIDTGKTIEKHEVDIEIKVKKIKHLYHVYKCTKCGKEVHVPIDNKLKEKNQYGSMPQALAMALMVIGNVSINKVSRIIEGMSDEEIKMSEGFIYKLYRRANGSLSRFMSDLKRELLSRKLIYWDDTVVPINKRRSIIRFYGDENISYYTAHNKKDKQSLIDDDILPLLTKDCKVMHDHNTVNYNEIFHFGNIECIQHLQRDLKKMMDDHPGHTWAGKVKELISNSINDMKEEIEKGKVRFDDGYIRRFHDQLDKFLKKGMEEYERDINKYSTIKEDTLIERIRKYRENYFSWLEDFRIPTTNNLSERGLRSIKSHTKISGQFQTEDTAKLYSTVKSYVETCHKNNINEMEALMRLFSDNPYTIEEIFNH